MIISSVEALPIRLPRDRDSARRTAGSPTRLAEGTGHYRWSAVFPALYPIHFETALIKITTRDGLVGWGEAQAPLAPEVACSIVDTLLAPVLRGCEFDGTVESIRELWDRMYSTMRVRGQTGGFMLDAISGVDIALWDLAGKAQGIPVCRLISDSPRSEVQAYLSGVSGTTREERASTVDARWSEGFRTFKLFHESTVDELLAAFDDLRTQIGSEAQIAVDALWRLTPETAPHLGGDLDDRDALWLEAPLPPEDAIAHGELSRKIRTPLALGESYRTRFEMAPFFREHALHFAQPDLGRTGITEGLRIAAQATEHGAAVVPHVSIALAPQIAAAVHLAAAVHDCPMLEYNPSVFSVANRYTETSLRFENANYIVPDRPGLGIDIAEGDLRRDLLRVTERA